MSLARFYSRISNAIGPLIGSDTALRGFLEDAAVALHAPVEIELYPEHRAGFLFAVNLCARLYPRLHIIGPQSIVADSIALVKRINPECDIQGCAGRVNAAVAWGGATATEHAITVSAENWSFHLDGPEAKILAASNSLTTLAAAAFAVGEVFRTVFARFLQSGRSKPNPASINILTLDGTPTNTPSLPAKVDVGRVHLVGAGAVGQATAFALSNLKLRGSIIVVDPESVEVSNLQRYVLSMDDDVGLSKCDIVERTLQNESVAITKITDSWGAASSQGCLAEDVCVAVDTSEARIGIQASLPRRIYNAWTQPADIGWSRHEHFGSDPCLACLYVPSGPRPSIHESIARAVRQAEVRVLAYLLFRVPVDVPLQIQQVIMLRPQPSGSDVERWSTHSVLDDIAQEFKIDDAIAATWRGKQISDLYREGICGGAIITDLAVEVPQEVLVPLAHQSALAGIMLATQLVAAKCSELANLRPAVTESRLNVLAPMPQHLLRPRQRTPGCLCQDPDFVARYHEKWS